MINLCTYKAFEKLNTSTYISAADKLQDNHPKRAKNLRQWANETEGDILYLHPHTFELDITTAEHKYTDFYYITKAEKGDFVSNRIEANGQMSKVTVKITEIEMESTKNKISMMIMPESTSNDLIITSVICDKISNKYTESIIGNVLLKSRKDAKLFIEIVEEESGRKFPVSINRIYKSE